ncbi:MAG: formyltransferase family protein [Pseudomonadota bacterium]
MSRIVIFASGEGTLFESIAASMNQQKFGYEVVALVTNKPDCGAAQKALGLSIPKLTLAEFLSEEKYEGCWVLLAGYLRLVPSEVLQRHPKRVVNSHPSLLPKFGGKGMYGKFVHEAVIASGEKESGFTLHYVSEKYDEGEVIFQQAIPVEEQETAKSLEEKIKAKEREKIPEILAELLNA